MIGDSFYHRAPGRHWGIGFSLRDLEKIKELRILHKATRNRLNEIEKRPITERDEIIKEKTLLKAIQKEIWRLERRRLFSEMGI